MSTAAETASNQDEKIRRVLFQTEHNRGGSGKAGKIRQATTVYIEQADDGDDSDDPFGLLGRGSRKPSKKKADEVKESNQNKKEIYKVIHGLQSENQVVAVVDEEAKER